MWNLIGGDIDGEFENDNSGWSVSLSSDGNTLAIGAPLNGVSAGHVRVFNLINGDWIKKGEDINGKSDGDQYGFSVSLNNDGNTVAIGARYNDDNGKKSGHFNVFRWDGTAWVQKGEDIAGKASGDEFGWYVSLSGDGNTVAAGAPTNDDNGSDSGHVRIYQWTEEEWIQKGQDIIGEAAGDLFGRGISLSTDGNSIAIVGIYNDDNGEDAGHVRVYEWNGNSWVQKGQDLDGKYAFERSGRCVSLSGDGSTVAIGANANDDSGFDYGQIRAFEWNGNSWVQKGQDINGEAEQDRWGNTVSLNYDGNILAGSSLYNDHAVSNAGHVRVFELIGGDWIQRGQDLDGEYVKARTGYAISLSSDGNRVAFGAPHNHGNGHSSGSVRVYDWDEPKIVESLHPYEPNTVLKWSIDIAKEFNGCAVLTMDPLSYTPSKKDAFLKLVLINGGTKSNVGRNKLFRKHLSQFPVTTVDGDSLNIVFKSTSALTDYGFKLYINQCPNTNE